MPQLFETSLKPGHPMDQAVPLRAVKVEGECFQRKKKKTEMKKKINATQMKNVLQKYCFLLYV